MAEPMVMMFVRARDGLGEFDTNKSKIWLTRGHGPNKFTYPQLVGKLHAVGKFCLFFGIGIARSAVELFEPYRITQEGGRTSSGYHVGGHPRGKMFLATFVDEGLT
jgi:hypothetical protein